MEDNIIINDAPITEPVPVDSETFTQTDEIIPAPQKGDVVPVPEEPNAPLAPTVAEFFGTLQESVTIVWRMHLKTKSYSIHTALNEFYYQALGIVDKIIEQYQGINGVIEDPYVNVIAGEAKTEVEYIQELKDFINANKYILGDYTEINSTIDDLLGIIDSTLYKIINLHENAVKSFEEFCYENYNKDNE